MTAPTQPQPEDSAMTGDGSREVVSDMETAMRVLRTCEQALSCYDRHYAHRLGDAIEFLSAPRPDGLAVADPTPSVAEPAEVLADSLERHHGDSLRVVLAARMLRDHARIVAELQSELADYRMAATAEALYEWYGASDCCLRCGERWNDGERAPRPFARGWRERSLLSAKAHWRMETKRLEATP